MAPPLTIGLTGGIAAGKSEALAAFDRLGAATLSSDAVVHELLESPDLQAKLVEHWGPEVVPAGKVDRARIGSIVFADRDELAWLESQIHPLVGVATAEWMAALPEGTELAVVEVPLLFEGGGEKRFDVTVAVVAAEETRRARAEARGHTLVDERAALQLTQAEKAERADHVVANEGSREDLERALSALIDTLKQ
jgi:dephospho-CoA kinase